jgi:hypothetical protein
MPGPGPPGRRLAAKFSSRAVGKTHVVKLAIKPKSDHFAERSTRRSFLRYGRPPSRSCGNPLNTEVEGIGGRKESNRQREATLESDRPPNRDREERVGGKKMRRLRRLPNSRSRRRHKPREIQAMERDRRSDPSKNQGSPGSKKLWTSPTFPDRKDRASHWEPRE